MKTISFALCFILVLLFSCANELKEGIVTEHIIEPAHDFIYMMPVPHTMRSGKITTTYFSYIPIWMHDDEDYRIKLHGYNDDGEELTETFYLRKSSFDSLALGQKYCINAGCSKSPNENIRK